MQRKLLFRLVLLVGVLLPLGLAGAASPAARAADFADSAFLRTWMRTDAPVAAAQAARSWYWGPAPRCSVREPYAEAPDGSGTRLVQYFDKSRMELNDPAADPAGPWYVTNGLLAYEMIAGQVQTGNNRYQARPPADIPLASDGDDASAPTYRSFQQVTSTPAAAHLSPSALGTRVTATIDRAGTTGNDPAKVYYPGTTIAFYEPTTHHNVPQIFWNFINQTGPVFVGGKLAPGKLSEPATFVTGLPISEAYWAHVRVGGQPTDVLIQVFQRRVLTYIPALAAPWNVQMGNIGAHYLLWRYGTTNCGAPPPPPAPPPTATPVPPVPAPRPATAVILYRLRNPQSGEHFYTLDPAERTALLRQGYSDEGSEGRVWDRAIPDTVPFYRLYNNAKGITSRHLYTTSAFERDVWLRAGWTLEYGPDGIPGAGYVYLRQAPQTLPLYRWYNDRTSDHLYTINPASAGRFGYKLEGVACYVIQP